MTYEMKSLFGTVFNGKKNTLRTRRAIAQDLYVPSSAVIGTAIATVLGLSGVASWIGVAVGIGFAALSVVINEFNRNGSGIYLDYSWAHMAALPSSILLQAIVD